MGGNAAFRGEVVGEVGGFHTGIGRSVQGRKSRPLGCEETEFCIRLAQREPGLGACCSSRDAVIGHKVPAARCTFAYFRSRCYAEGLSKALVTQSVGSRDGLASERAHALKTLPLGALRGVGEALRGDLAGLGRAGAIVVGLAWTTWGYVVGSRFGLKRWRGHDPRADPDVPLGHRPAQRRDPPAARCGPADLAEQLAYLKESGFTPLTLADLVASLNETTAGACPSEPIVVTFDDGYADFHSRGAAAARPLRLPGHGLPDQRLGRRRRARTPRAGRSTRC